jgi:hypothetical protein
MAVIGAPHPAEKCDIALPPCRVQVRGYLISWARELWFNTSVLPARETTRGGISMSDPRFTDRTLPPRPYSSQEMSMGAVIGTIAAVLLVLGIVVYGMIRSEPQRAGVTPLPETTGRSERAPVPPATQLPVSPRMTPQGMPPQEPRPQ